VPRRGIEPPNRTALEGSIASTHFKALFSLLFALMICSQTRLTWRKLYPPSSGCFLRTDPNEASPRLARQGRWGSCHSDSTLLYQPQRQDFDLASPTYMHVGRCPSLRLPWDNRRFRRVSAFRFRLLYCRGKCCNNPSTPTCGCGNQPTGIWCFLLGQHSAQGGN